MNSYLARQAIYKNKIIVGYELLYRTSSENFFPKGISDNEATIKIICNAFFDDYYDIISKGSERLWINFNENLLDLSLIKLLPKDKVVIEILETVKPSVNVLKKIKELHQLGYVIALDDFIFDVKWNEILKSITYIKFDRLHSDLDEIKESIFKISIINSNVKFLGEKIEDKSDINLLKAIGVDYYQGYSLSKPEIIKISHKNSKIINLYSEIQNGQYDDLEYIVNYLA